MPIDGYITFQKLLKPAARRSYGRILYAERPRYLSPGFPMDSHIPDRPRLQQTRPVQNRTGWRRLDAQAALED